MLKKLIPLILAVCLSFSISVMAENTDTTSDGNTPEAMQEMPTQDGTMPQGFPSPMAGGTMPEGRTPGGQMPRGDFTPPQSTGTVADTSSPQSESNQTDNNAPEGISDNNPQNTDDASAQNGQSERQFPDNMQGGFPGDMQNTKQQSSETESTPFLSFVKTYSTPVTSVILLALAFVFVVFYKRRNY